MTNLVANQSTTDCEIEELLRSVIDERPEEVLIVFMKDGDVCTRSSTMFSRIRTLGALTQLQFDIAKADEP